MSSKYQRDFIIIIHKGQHPPFVEPIAIVVLNFYEMYSLEIGIMILIIVIL